MEQAELLAICQQSAGSKRFTTQPCRVGVGGLVGFAVEEFADVGASMLTSMTKTLRRSAALGLIVAAVLVAVTAPVPGARAADARALCGVERWTVKTLQDRPQLLPVQATTIKFLVTRPAPHPLPAVRLAFERHVYRVRAAVTLVRAEDDGDFHLVLRDGAQHMIAEAPASSCIAKATPTRRAQMRAARSAIRLCAHAEVTGAAFFDFKHGQTGVAANAIELHPILGFRCLSG